MSKQAKDEAPKEPKKIKILSFPKEGSGLGFIEWEIDPAVLKKHGKELSRIEPDIFAVFLIQIQKKLREIFEF